MICNMEEQCRLLRSLSCSGMMKADPVFVEFGAGRGMLSLGIDFSLNGRLPTEERKDDVQDRGKYLLIDMSPVRFKADRWLRHKESNFCRITGNIRDSIFVAFPSLKRRKTTSSSELQSIYAALRRITPSVVF